MVYWVIAKSMIRADAGPRSVTLVRQGPFESHILAVQAQRTVLDRYRDQPGAVVEIKLDFA